MEPAAQPANKSHKPSKSKKKKTSTGTGGKKTAVAKPGAFARRIRLTADRAEKRAPNPNVPIESINGDAAPRLVAVVGPSGVGKTTIIRNLVRHYSKRKLPSVTGPVTLVAGRKKRLTFLEVGPDLSSMIDAAKIADLVLLVIDAAYGFEMETFEFLNIAAAHGMPKIIAILTHLDKLPDGRQVARAKKTLKDRIWAELYDGAKVFYLSGITTTGDYLSREVLNLARFISVAKQANLRWRLDHPYMLADRVEDITDKSQPDHADRTVALYGYIRGASVRPRNGQWSVHLAGVSDLVATNLEALTDPCPPPEVTPNEAAQKDATDGKRSRRRVSERERVVHAPMAPEVDGISYDRDAVYINLAPGNIRFSDKKAIVSEQNMDTAADDPDAQALNEDSSDGEGEKMVKSLQKSAGSTVDESLKMSELQLVTGGKRLKSEQFSEDRKRRPANFTSADDSEDSGDSSEESEEGSESSEDDSEAEQTVTKGTRNSSNRSESAHDEDSEEKDGEEESDDDEDEQSDEDVEEEGEGDDEANAQRWKEQMLDNAAQRMKSSISPSKALAKLIYDKDADGSYSRKYDLEVDVGLGDNTGNGEDNNEDDQDDLFTRRRERGSSGRGGDPLLSIPDGVADDMTKLLPNAVRDWVNDERLCKRLRRVRWATGYKESVADAGEDDEKEDEDGSVDGDFEDMETGDVHHGRDSDKAKVEASNGGGNDSENLLEKIRQEKIRKKQRFDSKWDNRGSRKDENSDEDNDDAGDGNGPDMPPRRGRGEGERTVDPRRVERDRLDRIRQEELEGLDAETLLEVQGMQPGQYVRVELKNVPVEFVELFDARNPVILGGLQAKDDEGMSFLRARVRRHRFKRGVLKSSDPVIFSVGWRRFQSMPVYDTEDVGGRRRFLKYTPEFLHCNATFWGPGVSPGVGVVLCQTLGRERAGFRVAGTGVVTEISSTCNVVKKLKLTGEPVRVHKNTAFIKGMFSSESEASKFIGAGIRTVSGIRGTIKKAISEVSQRNGLDRAVAKSPAGTYRAGFEDRILLSDIVFLRTWVPVEAPRFCSVAANLLERGGGADGKGSWRMRTIREVRQAKGMAIPLQKDSLYKDVERKDPMFARFKLSRKLEAGLPFASKPKDFAPKNYKDLPERKAAVREERAVVLTTKEKKEHTLLQAVYTIRNDSEKRRKQTRMQKLEEKKREWKKADEKHQASTKASMKRKFAITGAREAREAKRGRKGGD